MLGELFAAQLRHTLAEAGRPRGPHAELSFNGRKEFGEFLKEKIFKPGNRAHGPSSSRTPLARTSPPSTSALK